MGLWITPQPCAEPVDDSGRLTECFINTLGEVPLSAQEAFDISFRYKQDNITKELQPIFELIRTKATEGLTFIKLPCFEEISIEDKLKYRNMDTLKIASQVSYSIQTGKNILKFDADWLNDRVYRYALESLGYDIEVVKQTDSLGYYLIKWNK